MKLEEITEEEWERLGDEYAEFSGYEEDYILKDIAKAHADGIRKGMEFVLNTLEYSKDMITKALSDIKQTNLIP